LLIGFKTVKPLLININTLTLIGGTAIFVFLFGVSDEKKIGIGWLREKGEHGDNTIKRLDSF